jgi:hypothetical protein
MLKKDSPTNQAAALNAVLPEKHKAETVIRALSVKCSRQYVLLAVKKPQYLSNLQATNPFIAVIAISLAKTIGKVTTLTPFPAQNRGGC